MLVQYNLEIQARILVALCLIHNFITKYDSSEVLMMSSSQAANCPGENSDDNDHANYPGMEPEWEQETSASIQCNQIAEIMWESYQQITAERAQRGEVDLDSDSDDEVNDDDDDDDDD
jgi:hypothetical protein